MGHQFTLIPTIFQTTCSPSNFHFQIFIRRCNTYPNLERHKTHQYQTNQTNQSNMSQPNTFAAKLSWFLNDLSQLLLGTRYGLIVTNFYYSRSESPTHCGRVKVQTFPLGMSLVYIYGFWLILQGTVTVFFAELFFFFKFIFPLSQIYHTFSVVYIFKDQISVEPNVV